MNLLQSFLGLSLPSKTPETGQSRTLPSASTTSYTLTDTDLEQFLRGGRMSKAGISVNVNVARQLGVANRCEKLICSAISTMAFDVKRVVGDKRVDVLDHQASILMRRRPNGWQTPAQFKSYLQSSVLNEGNGYALKVRSRGRITDLWPMDPRRVRVEQSDTDMSLQYRYQRKSGGEITFPQSEIFHLRGPSDDTITGKSVISAAAESMGLADAMRGHASRMFKSGTTFGGVFKHPKTMGEPGLKRFKASLDDYRGALSSKSFADIVLEEGMDYSKIGLSSVDAQLLQIMEATDYGICMFYGVPPHMVGLTSKTTSWGSGIEQQSKGFVAYTLIEHMTLWQQTIERDLFEPTDIRNGLYAKFNPASLIQGDIKTRYAAYAIGRQWGWESANSVLALEDRDGIGPQGDIYLTPANMADASDPADPLEENDNSSVQDPEK